MIVHLIPHGTDHNETQSLVLRIYSHRILDSQPCPRAIGIGRLFLLDRKA